MAREISDASAAQIALAARFLNMSFDETLEYMLATWKPPHGDTPTPATAENDDDVLVYAVYQQQRIEARFYRSTKVIVGVSGPIEGKTFASPSGAARAVVAALNPDVNSNRSGMKFWRIAASGKELGTIM